MLRIARCARAPAVRPFHPEGKGWWSWGWHPGMSFCPGQKVAVQPMLFGGPVCAVCAVCAAELAWAGKGRRPKYCSKVCSSKADRAREKEKRSKALAVAAEARRGETGLPDGLADDPVAAELLALGDRLARADRLLLLQLDRAARDNDPALARQALTGVLHCARAATKRSEGPALRGEVEQDASGPRRSPRRRASPGTRRRGGVGPTPCCIRAGPSTTTAGASPCPSFA
ncbi:hypothetical protein ACFWA9_27075 [Kitasatospora sp. NPDC059973]|uniref:hypothetical protein n=1 Tax=Kitasatospora sp. NPDC059973 TaxID=3347020 RepID=UPI0036842F4B